jgi:hypothetical protein
LSVTNVSAAEAADDGKVDRTAGGVHRTDTSETP